MFMNIISGRKHFSNCFGAVIVAPHLPGKGFKALSKQFGVHHSVGRKTFFFLEGKNIQGCAIFIEMDLHSCIRIYAIRLFGQKVELFGHNVP